MSSTDNSSPILMKLAPLPYIFEKYSNIKSRENPSSGILVIPCEVQDERTGERTDRYDDTNSHFSQFARA
jgi:hypothetical protein